MIVSHVLRHSWAENDNEFDGNDAMNWIKGFSSVQQIYIILKFKKKNGYASDDQMIHIDTDKLSSLKKKYKKEEKELKKRWEVYTT